MQKNSDFDNIDTYLFKDRIDAANKLLEVLPKEMLKKEEWLILALSKGGAVISSIISKELGINFELFIVEPILAPKNDECEIAMVSESRDIVMHEALINSFEIDEEYIYEEANRVYKNKIESVISRYRYSLPLPDLKNRSILLVDEGIESGLRTMCAIKSVLNMDIKKVSIAVPMIDRGIFHELDMKVDSIYTCKKVDNFIRTDYYYEEIEKIKRKKFELMLKGDDNFLPNIKGEANEP